MNKLFPMVLATTVVLSACADETPKRGAAQNQPPAAQPTKVDAANNAAAPAAANAPAKGEADAQVEANADPKAASEPTVAPPSSSEPAAQTKEAQTKNTQTTDTQAAALPWRSIDIPFTQYTLDNGLTLIVHEDHKAPLVAINVWYHVGSKNEKLGKTGYAHLFEHLMFNGSENYNKDYFKVMEKIGATKLNGTTNEDRTNYFQNVPTNAVDTVLMLESDRMGYLLGALDKAKLDEQRKVVKNEKRQREDKPYGKMWPTMVRATYPEGHPYSWPVIGSMEDLDASSVEDMHTWFKNYYGPNNAVIVLAGNIKPEVALEKVKHWFGAIPRGPKVEQPVVNVAKMKGKKEETIYDNVPAERILKVWNLPEGSHIDVDHAWMAAEVLSSGKNSRLYKRLVLEEQLVSSVWAYVDGREIASQFMLSATALPGADLNRVEQILDEELAKFIESGPTDAEIHRLRASYYAGAVRILEKIDGFGGKSDILASAFTLGGAADSWKISQERVFTANNEQVRAVAERWLSDGQYALRILPNAKKPKELVEAEKQAAAKKPSSKLEDAARAAAEKAHAELDKKKTETAAKVVKAGEQLAVTLPGNGKPQADRSSVPKPGPAADLILPKIQKFELKNGLKVWLAERHEAPVVQMGMLFKSGYASDSRSKGGIASMAMSLLDEGAAGMTNLEIAEKLELLGAGVGAGAGIDDSTVSLSALKANLKPSLEIYAKVLRQPDFPADQVERVRKQILAKIKKEQASPVSIGLRVLPPLLYGDHPYGQPLTGSGTFDSVKSITRDDLVKFHRDWIRPDNGTLVVVGAVSRAELEAELNAVLGDWQAPGEKLEPLTADTVARPANNRVFFMHRPKSSQATVFASHVAPPKNDESDIGFVTVNAVFGRMFTSRLNMNLREDKGWTYGAGAFLIATNMQRMFGAYASVQADKTGPAMQEVKMELDKIVTPEGGVTAAELAFAQNYLTLKLPGKNETSGQVLSTVMKLLKYNLADDYYSTFIGKIRGQSTDDVLAAAQKLYHPQSITWVVVGDREVVMPQLKEVGYGDIVELDKEGKPVK